MAAVFKILLALLLLLPAPLSAQIAFNNSCSGVTDAGSGSSATAACTANAGTDRLALIAACIGNGPITDESMTPITWGGSATGITLIGEVEDSTPGQKCELYYLIAPPLGAATLAMSTTIQAFTGVGAVILNGVQQTGTPHRAICSDFDTSGAGTPSCDAASVSGDWVVDAITGWFFSVSAGAGQTQRFNVQNANNRGFAMSTETASGASTTMSWTKGGGDYHAHIAVALIPAPAAPTTNVVPPYVTARKGQ